MRWSFGHVQSLLMTLLVLSLLPSISALEISYTPEASIYPNETAVYTFVVSTEGRSSEKAELLLTLDSKWSFETNPLSYLSGFTVSGLEETTFDFIITPTSPYLSSGKYAIQIPIRSETGEEEVADLILYIKNPEALTGYLPSLNFLLDAQEQVDPRQIQKVKLDIENKNPLDVGELTVQLKSDLYNGTKTATVGPLGTASVLFEITYDAQQPPAEDLLVITVFMGEKAFTPIRKQIEIIPYAEIVEIQYPTKSFLFKTTQTTEYTNKGNSDIIKELTFATSEFEQYFTEGDPEGEIVEKQGLLYYQTNVTLSVDVPVLVTYSVNYRPILYAILLLAGAIWLYYVFRSPIVVKKEIMTLHTNKEGQTKLKILLHIKNRSMKLIDDMDVIDKIPAVAEIEKHFELGTMKPEKILKHEKAGTVLQWHIPHVEAYEERIITYKVSSIYQIVGDYKLPAAVVRFKNKQQQAVKVVSNTVKVGKKAEDQ